MKKINAWAVGETAKKETDKALERRIWNLAGKQCPFKTNRGYFHEDEDCLICEFETQHTCQYDTSRRVHTIRKRLIHDFIEEEDWYEDSTYLDIARHVFDEEEEAEERKDIRNIANQIIKRFSDWDLDDIAENIHPNTLEYFRNCFPEWNDFENGMEKEDLHLSMESFHAMETRKSFQFWRRDDEAIAGEYQETLVLMNNWRGFPFDSIWHQDEDIPRKVIKDFAQAYFKWRNEKIQTEKDLARDMGLFGKAAEPQRWPMKWMLSKDNATIKKFIQSDNGQVFCQIMAFMESHHLKRQQGEKVAEKTGNGDQNYIVIQIDRKAAAQYLNQMPELKNIPIGHGKLSRFLKWMADNDLILQLGKPGRNEFMAYAIGKWTAYPDPETDEMRPGRKSLFVRQKDRGKLQTAIQKGFWN
jgi:hypothetical protein